MFEVPIQDWLALLIGAAFWTFARAWTSGAGVGLVFAYVFSFVTLYALAPAMYLLPWYDMAPGYDLTAAGLREASLAMLGFAVGSEIARPFARSRTDWLDAPEHPGPIEPRLTNLLLLTGAVLYVATFALAGVLPGISAIVSTGSMVAVVALALKCWSAWHAGRGMLMWLWLAATLTLPFVTVVGQGFLGYGFAAMMTIFAFVASYYRPRTAVVVAGLLLGYIGLSVYVTYMRDRRDIRAVVWTGGAMEERIGQIGTTLSTIEWFDPRDVAHLDRIDVRLNQDYLLGAAVAYLAGGSTEFAHGRTMWEALVALVPRAIWPNKPAVAGSGNLVSDFTGIRFADGTSVGIGQVMEAYVNFGRTGVVLVFIVIGALVSSADRLSYARLARGQAGDFLVRYLPALSLLQVGGSFAETTSSGAAAFLVAVVMRRATTGMAARRAAIEPVADENEPVAAVERTGS